MHSQRRPSMSRSRKMNVAASMLCFVLVITSDVNAENRTSNFVQRLKIAIDFYRNALEIEDVEEGR